MKPLLKILVRELRNAANNIENGTCVIDMEAAEDIINILAHIPLSKEQACEFLNVSRATFDNYIGLGKLPKGRKEKGKKELIWYKDELQQCIDRLKH